MQIEKALFCEKNGARSSDGHSPQTTEFQRNRLLPQEENGNVFQAVFRAGR
jgi:hypothetical protein